MLISKLQLAILAAAFASVVWLEHAHRVKIAAPTAAEISARDAACPENESVPFSADCMSYIQGRTEPGGKIR
jgi:hypothetical protein